MNLCAHVDLEVDGDALTVTRGVAVPFYGWDPELQADVPLLHCSTCDATARLLGPTVARSNRVTARNRQEGWELL